MGLSLRLCLELFKHPPGDAFLTLAEAPEGNGKLNPLLANCNPDLVLVPARRCRHKVVEELRRWQVRTCAVV